MIQMNNLKKIQDILSDYSLDYCSSQGGHADNHRFFRANVSYDTITLVDTDDPMCEIEIMEPRLFYEILKETEQSIFKLFSNQ